MCLMFQPNRKKQNNHEDAFSGQEAGPAHEHEGESEHEPAHCVLSRLKRALGLEPGHR